MAPALATDVEQDEAAEQTTETQPLLQQAAQQHPTTQQILAASVDKNASGSNLHPGSPTKAAGSQLLRQAAALLSKQSSGNACAKRQELGQCRWVLATHCHAAISWLSELQQYRTLAALYLCFPCSYHRMRRTAPLPQSADSS